MKKKNILIAILSLTTALFSTLGVTFLSSAQKTVNATTIESGWESLFDVTSEESYEFTNNKKAHLYNLTGLGLHFTSDITLTYKTVVNKRALTKDYELFNFYVDPVNKDARETDAITEFSDVAVRLENWYNPNEFIEIQVFNSVHNSKLCWATASTNTMPAYGMKQGVIHTATRRGTPINGSFSGACSDIISVRYDTDLNTAFGYNSLYNEESYGGIRHMIRTFSNPNHVPSNSDLFFGFSSNHLRLSLKFSNVTNKISGANVIISKVLGQSYQSETAIDKEKPSVFLNYDIDKAVPVGEVNTPFPMFDVDGFDAIDGDINDVEYTIYNKKDLTTPIIKKVNLDSFTPTEAGDYRIEMRVIDSSGNDGLNTIDIKVLNCIQNLNVELNGEIPKNVNLGQVVILPTYKIYGGSGIISENLVVKDPNGNEVPVLDNKFQANLNGSYMVNYYFTDYLGYEFIINKRILTKMNLAPVFSEVVIPSYIKKNNYITLNIPTALDYSSYLGETHEVPVKALVCENDVNGNYTEVTANEDGKFTYMPSNTATSVFVKYKATALVNDNYVSYSTPKEIKVVEIGEENGNEKLYDYFYTNGISKEYEYVNGNTEELKEIHFKTQQQGSTVEFINPLRSGGLSFGMAFDPGKSYFTKITVELFDVVNPNETITLIVTPSNADDKSLVSTVHGERAQFDGAIYNTTDKTSILRLMIGNTTHLVNDKAANVLDLTRFDNGEEFKGFSSGKIYLKITFDEFDSSKENSFRFDRFYNINSLYEGIIDINRPVISTTTTVPSYAVLMDEVIIPGAIASDVLSPNCDAYLTLRDPNDNFVLGSSAQGVKANKNYSVFVNIPGMYLLEYSSADETGKQRKITYQINTIDTIVPKIEIDGQIKSTYKEGEALTIPPISIIDNAKEVNYYVYLQTPTYGRKIIQSSTLNETYVFKRKGEYKLIVFAIDNSSNSTEKTFIINVV